MTNTPRTDDVADRWLVVPDGMAADALTCYLEHGRMLEREVNAAQAEIIRLSNRLRTQPEAGRIEQLQMQIGYLATKLMVAGDTRSLPEIVKEAADACGPQEHSE